MKSILLVLLSLFSLVSASCLSKEQIEKQLEQAQAEKTKLINNYDGITGFSIGSAYFLSIDVWDFGPRSDHMVKALYNFKKASQELVQEGYVLEPASVLTTASIGKTGADHVWITATFIKP